MRILYWYLLSILFLWSTQAQPYIVNNTTNSPNVLKVAFDKVNSNTLYFSNSFALLPDAHTNAFLNSTRQSYWTTNVINFTNDVRYTLPCSPVTNFAGATWTVVSGTPQMEWSSDNTNWNSDANNFVTNSQVWLSFTATAPPSFGTPINPSVTNVTIYSMVRPDLFGRTNQLVGQTLEMDYPTLARHVATKEYVDAQFAAVNYVQNGGIYLVESDLNYNGQWTVSAHTNGLFTDYLGAGVMQIENPTLNFGTITRITCTNTTVYISVWTNGVTSEPKPQWTASLTAQKWQLLSSYTNSYPTAVGTNYTISFTRPNPTNAFIRAGFASANPNFVNLSAMLNTTPRTISNATDSTWGKGAGILTWDTNYLYLSVGTNAWKRVAVATW